MALANPSSVSPPKLKPKRDAGGDNTVPRDGLGRPRIKSDCVTCDKTGQVPSEKRPGKTVKCKVCGGTGIKEVSYTRVTTFIDVLEDKSNLQQWAQRMVLLGLVKDPKLLNDVKSFDPETREGKDALNRRAEKAKEIAGANDKADRGTHLHALSEMVDEDIPLPLDIISFEDILDMDAYKQATTGFEIKHMERLVVNDELKCAGTPDRVSVWVGDKPLVAPDGYVFELGELIITDLKTGTVQYGGLKMAMQLAIYSRSLLYSHETFERTPMGKCNQKWGVIMHVAAGSGEATLYWADLELGWASVQLAQEVRAVRGKASKALTELTHAVGHEEEEAGPDGPLGTLHLPFDKH